MNRRELAVLVATALIVATVMPGTALAESPKRQFERLDVSKIDPNLGPALLANREMTVIAQMQGEPASAQNGLTNRQRVEAAKRLKAAQDQLDPQIAALGGQILGKYQFVYNGIKVRIAGRDVAALSTLPNVVAVRGLQTFRIDNVNSVPFIGTQSVWSDLGQTGAGQTIAVIDTGIDYLHANLGGAGDPAAFAANDPTVVEPDTFPTTKVIAGWDFAGNNYDAEGSTGSLTPSPDPDPLDCNGHGSHVSGTAAGNGVLADGTAFTGPYDANTYSNSFAIGPGVAPEAKLVALKVFGCEGSTDLTVDALEWVGNYNATNTDAIDVVNMSLGSSLGRDDDPTAVASNTLVESGVVVVASAGNSGAGAYMTGSPASASGVISVAAEDTLATFPGVNIDFAEATDISNANNQNAHPGLPVSGNLKVIFDSSGALSLGCDQADYGTLPPNSIVAIQRGVCPFVTKGEAAQAAGAIGIIDVNRDDIVNPDELPTFIGYNPEIFDIPMVGTGRGVKAAIIAADGQAVTLQPSGSISNPTFKRAASFTSGGPRNGDSAAKPDVTAPGVSVVSTLVGSGTKGTTLSGTSMSSPHTAGVAALVRAGNPSWDALQVKAAIMNTADASAALTSGYAARIWGSGLVQPRRAIDTVALATTGSQTASLSFGYDPAGGAYSETLPITLWNNSGSDLTYNLAGASIVTVSPSTVTVPANSSATVDATASLSTAALAAEPTTSVLLGGVAWGGVRARTGVIVATPTTSGAGIYPLRIPFTAVPRALSNVVAGTRSAYLVSKGIARATVPLTNSGVRSGFADVYAWGLSDPQDLPSTAIATNDIRAVGVQAIPAEALTGEPDPNDMGLIFAVNTWGRWSTGSSNEIDIAVYGANKNKPDYFVVGVDFGAVTAGSFDGRFASIIFSATGDILDAWVADAPANGSTVLLPVLASEIGQTVDNAMFSYSVTGFSVEDHSLVDAVAGQAEFGVKKPAISTGDFIEVAPGATATLDLVVDKGKLAVSPALGWMIVTLDDANGAAQADLVPIGRP